MVGQMAEGRGGLRDFLKKKNPFQFDRFIETGGNDANFGKKGEQ